MTGAIPPIGYHGVYRDIFILPLCWCVIARFQVVRSFPETLTVVAPTVLTATYVSIMMHRIRSI